MLAVGRIGGVGRLGLVAAAVRAPFDPRREFFSNGEQGVWYDPSDLSTLFQDSAGTIPVTAVEQPVGRMLDKSGRGNHAFMATAIDRPILRQDAGGRYYLSANGTNTWMQTNSIDFTGTDKVTVFAGVRKLSDAEAVIFEFSTGSAFSTNGSFALYARAPSSADSNMVFRSRGTSVADVFRPAASPISVIASASSDIGGDAARLRVNGVSATPFLGDQGAGPYGNYPLYLFRRAGTSSPANIQFHGLLISGALHADSKNAAMERWLAPKTGATL